MDLSKKKMWYEIIVRVNLLELHSTGFEDFFKKYMSLKYNTNFIGAKPWGNDGDGGCDGYLINENVLFQCYAPKRINKNKMMNKISSDFNRAKKLWPTMKKWVFVFSNQEITPDIPSPVTQFWIDFVSNEKKIQLEFLSTQQFMNKILELDANKLSALFDFNYPMPNIEGMNDVYQNTIDDVINKIMPLIEMNLDLDPDLNFEPVPEDKIAKNNLNKINTEYLISGEKKAYYIDMYIKKSGNELFIDKLSSVFKNEYLKYKKQGYDSDSIFFKLIVFIGYEKADSDTERGAFLAIISYLFNNCTIFES